MASTQKKSTKKKEEKPPRASSKLPYVPNMVARGIGAGVCLFLAILVALGTVRSNGVVVDFLCNSLKGLVGYGFFLIVPVLIAAAVLLLWRKKRVAARLWCLGLLPVFLGAFLHTFLSPYEYAIAPSSLSHLLADGRDLFGGGVLGGFLSVSFVTWFSKAGAAILFLVVLLFLLAVAFHLTPMSVAAHRRKRREQREYDDFDDYEEIYAAESTPQPEAAPMTAEEPARQKPQMEMEDTGHLYGLNRVPFRKGKRDSSEAFAGDGGKKSPLSFLPGKDALLEKGKDLFLGRSEEDVWAEASARAEEQDLPREEAPVPPTQEPDGAQRIEKPTTSRIEPSNGQDTEHGISESWEPAARPKKKNPDRKPGKGKGSGYEPPKIDLLGSESADARSAAGKQPPAGRQKADQKLLEDTFRSFGIPVTMGNVVAGPSVTRYEATLEQGIRLNKVTNLSEDVALAMGVSGVRIAPVPGEKLVVGIEVPNKVTLPVPIRSVLESEAFRKHPSKAAFAVGKDIGGHFIVGDCAKLPHLLIAGTTGSGKSVCINSLIVSMLFKARPEELRFIMVDPKMVELGIYKEIPHQLIPVVTDPKRAAGALQWAVTDMMKRYRMFSEAGVRELSSYNEWVEKWNEQPGREEGEKKQPLPRVVIVIDELADLMLVAAKEVEESICRVAQMGRAAGMHLVIATQRPSADVITGLMKANIPSRIAFAVASSLESRIILDTTGAEKLIGKGDMLWSPLGAGKPLRVQGCFISDEEVAKVVTNIMEKNGGACYDDKVEQEIEQNVTEAEKKGKSTGGYPQGEGLPGEQDELFEAAVDVVLELGQASVSMLQRRLKLGYARAARLVDQMEEKGIVGPFEGSKPRQMLITKEQWEMMKESEDGDQNVSSDLPVEEEILPFDPIPPRNGT